MNNGSQTDFFYDPVPIYIMDKSLEEMRELQGLGKPEDLERDVKIEEEFLSHLLTSKNKKKSN